MKPFDLAEAVQGNNILDFHDNEFRVLHFNEEFDVIMVKQENSGSEPFLLDVEYAQKEFHMKPKEHFMWLNVYENGEAAWCNDELTANAKHELYVNIEENKGVTPLVRIGDRPFQLKIEE